MKVNHHMFPIRSRFKAPCTKVIRTHRDGFLVGKTIQIHLSRQGFNRRIIATIDKAEPTHFRTEIKYEETWLSARLRAAALALYQEGLFGKFELAHEEGLHTIRYLGS